MRFRAIDSELSGVQFWSEIILVISNQTRAVHSFDFAIAYDFRSRPNCTPLSSITIINHDLIRIFHKVVRISSSPCGILINHDIIRIFY